MASITLRATKGSPLTSDEADTNISNLNQDVSLRLLSTSYTAADVLSKLLTVTGPSSGSTLSADTLKFGTLTVAASTANTASTIVARDASGNFAAGNITVSLMKTGAGADIASAPTIDLTVATGNTVVITGTATTTALTMITGQQMILLPSDTWPMTFNATTLNINGGVSYTCVTGDRVFAVKDLAGIIRVTVMKQDGTTLIRDKEFVSMALALG